MLDSLYGDLLGGKPPDLGESAEKPKADGDDMFSQPKDTSPTASAAAAATPASPKAEAKSEGAPPPLAQTFSAAKLMMPPVRKRAEPGKKPVMLDLQKLQEEKQALMRQRAAAAEKKEDKAPSAPVGGAAPSPSGGGAGLGAGLSAADDSPPMASSGPTSLTGAAAANLYGSPDEEYDPAKPNDYDEFCRRRMRQKAEEEMERRRQETIARQQQAAKPAEPQEDDFATRMMKKMGWKGEGLGKEGQGIAAPLVMKKTDVRAGVIVEGQKREAPTAQPPGQPEQKKANQGFNRAPTRVLLLNNMVGAGEVDEDLEEETGEEAGKYGKLRRCVIREIKGLPDDQAVRIFLEYEKVEDATKALVDMNGRYFGGRTVRARFYDEERFAKGDLDKKDHLE